MGQTHTHTHITRNKIYNKKGAEVKRGGRMQQREEAEDKFMYVLLYMCVCLRSDGGGMNECKMIYI